MTMFASTRVMVLDSVTGRPADICRGPHPDGSCSMPSARAFRCLGRAIVAEPAGDRRRVRLIVPDRLDRCPLAPAGRSEVQHGLHLTVVGHPWAG